VRPRYENLFDPLVLVAELRAGRVRIAPERAQSEGFEILLNGELPVPWWFGYSVSHVDDVIGGVRVPRSWDQRHAANAGVTWEVGAWSLSAAASLHSGWPVTELFVTADAGSGAAIVVAGERNAAHLGALRRLDFRASKDFAVGNGSLRFFAELTNLTSRRNPCCLAYETVTLPDGSASLVRTEESSLPLTGNIGLLWEF
jgi:hypothetical protein